MGVKNVVNIPSDQVDSALSLSQDDFKASTFYTCLVTLQHNDFKKSTSFKFIHMLLPIITKLRVNMACQCFQVEQLLLFIVDLVEDQFQ